MKFIHAADLHIDSPLRGLDSYEGAPVERLRGATRQALIALVELAIEQQVDFVILAGDIYDGNWMDFRTGLFFREQMLRLTRAGIRVYMVKGNHDAESQITKQLPAVDGVHVFKSTSCETFTIDELAVALHGRSFPSRAVPEDLVEHYPPARAGMFNIGVLHTSLTGRTGHDPYAPTTVDILCSKGYDYFALGHVHAREVVRDKNPRIVYPGNLQGRHAREIGPKGCELVTVTGGTISHSEFVALDVVRWHQAQLDITGVDSIDAFARNFMQQAARLVAGERERLHALRVLVTGESDLVRIEAEQPGTIAAAIQAATQDFDEADLWIEQVQLELRAPLDRAPAAKRQDAVGEVVRLVDEIAADDLRLQEWALAQLSGMGTLPLGLADCDPTTLDPAVLRAALADAEATVLAHLGATEAVGAAQ
ncbi:metallophosphoesterase family protein [Noviherbaspirillum sedimenti]|uniref:DNA repair exonuclease n=1 Tax=Noviherbaspirillum sedimenti TaxID=2320865 RepID=A0A3A3G6H0_9BURK|nr:DNA repair exonuclease [Noviherbaspirillum sedimenti]RJG04127.1 DNA repair exonuclease [Noviherbaspirillum sedimenti]